MCLFGFTQQDKIINIHKNHSYNFGKKKKKRKKEWDSALTHRTGLKGIGGGTDWLLHKITHIRIAGQVQILHQKPI